jgi:hypothetical protein
VPPALLRDEVVVAADTENEIEVLLAEPRVDVVEVGGVREEAVAEVAAVDEHVARERA